MDKYFPHKDLTYKIIGIFYKIHNDYGCGQKEIIYQNALAEELEEAKIPYRREVDIPIISSKTKKRLGNYRVDFLIDTKIILEIKAIKFTFNKLEQQIFSYLKSTPYEIGYLVNFGSPKLYLKRYILTNDRKSSVLSVSPQSVKSVSLGFTLIELLTVISLVIIIAVVALVLFNPMQQIGKGYDAKRKHDLVELRKAFEDYYNDKGCYPLSNEVCYPNSQPGYNPNVDTKCYICGNESSPANFVNFSPYLSRLPCDPRQPAKKYLYQVDNISCPTWYRTYADLSVSDYVNNDPATEEVGCYSQSCGLSPDYGYDYGVTSGNIDLERSSSFSYCATSGCNACGSYQDCLGKDISFFCQEIIRIMPVTYCGIQNCPCQSH